MTGNAEIRLRDDRKYVGEASLIDGVLTAPAARLRVRTLQGDRLYEPTARSWAPHEWSEVKWLEPELEQAAS
jgi:hypothetical protein